MDDVVIGVPSRSPWIAQLAPDHSPRPLEDDVATDVVIVGAGIAGIATAFFTLRATPKRVLLIERNRCGRGATGHNAGQLATYFERPLCDIAEEFGAERAIAAQRELDGAHHLLDVMAAESNATVRIERFFGNMGMFTANHLEVHLRNNLLRRDGGLPIESCVVSDEAEFLDRIAPEFSALYAVVPQALIREMLGTDDDRYRAVLSNLKGCANSALLVQQVLEHLQRRYADRFRYVDHTPVRRIVLDDGSASLEAGGHLVTATNVVLCTNGFAEHVVENRAGDKIDPPADQKVFGTVGYMSGFFEDEPRPSDALSFIRNETIGGETPYVYVTRRAHDGPHGTVTLTCMGGPERALEIDESYEPDSPFPVAVLAEMDEAILPLAQPNRAPGRPYEFAWHGLMAYTPARIRVIGTEPRNPVLLYNLGCNGVGFLPSICGGDRIARLISGEQLVPSIFDPR